MKKKVLSLCLILAFVAIAALSSTLAYFTDTDGAHNTFVVGDVQIELWEQQRDTDGKLVDFANDKPLLPAVYYDVLTNGLPNKDGTVVTPNGATVPIYDASVINKQDKIVSVKNTGTHDAFVRVIFAVEDKKFETEDKDGNVITSYLTDLVHFNFNADFDAGMVEWLKDADGNPILVSLTDNKGVAADYSICTYTYKQPVSTGNFTPASLLQIYLDPMWNNACSYTVGERYDVYVVAQAVQADGFMADAYETALNIAFGEVDQTCVDWFVFVGE